MGNDLTYAQRTVMARDASIDVLKGISILSIMLLHYEQGLFPGWLNAWIGNFMISAFYFTSGWVQSGKPDSTFKEMVRKRWHTLGIPYLCFSALLIGVSLVFWAIGHYEFRIVLRDIYKTLTLRGIGTLWFLPALFGGEVLAWRFRHDGLLGRTVLIIVTIAFVCLYAHWDSTYAHSGDWWRMADAPFRTLHDALKAWYVIVIGYYLGKSYRSELADMPPTRKMALGGVVLTWYTLMVFGQANGCSSLASSLGPFGLLLLCQTAGNLACFNWLAWFGQNSLIVMATHYSILQELCIFINRRWGTGTEELEGWAALGYFSASLLVEIPVVCCFKRHCGFVFGKRSLKPMRVADVQGNDIL